ncbi:hypothetical protein LIER_13332 [Lithospermum erythrorhizon]|uniref:Integrase catalytic domain-containing protein n=1 Tax=Lithospermum erythrorhizon TaxID=34254 RepID=A0AAV3PYA2_LITER
MDVSGKGNVRLEIDGLTYVITDVYLIPELKNNLLSVGQLQEKGLSEKRMVQGLPNFKAKKLVCVDCLSGKQTRKAIPHQSSWRADHILELVYADLCGPITPPSSSGKKYFLSIIDDHSRKGWIYLLTCKSEAFDHFKKFRNMVEKETSMSIKCFRSDRGGEFNST